MKGALVVGGSSGIGAALVAELLKEGKEKVFIIGKEEPVLEEFPEKIRDAFIKKTEFFRADLTQADYSVFDKIGEIDELYITAGFGRVAPFENITEREIESGIKLNVTATIRIIKRYYPQILEKEDFYCAFMGSIAGHVASPLFALYGAEKSALASFAESVNCELSQKKSPNRITEIAPGSIKGTRFNGGKNNIELLETVAKEILENTRKRVEFYVPNYEIYGKVLERYRADGKKFAKESYEYKVNEGRITEKPQTVVGYLSGTFDLFHIGHLNLIRRAREKCDYLIVGVHDSGAWKGKETYIPFEERLEIIRSLKYVDLAVKSYPEDSDAYLEYKYDKLFVGSDYKGSERFNRYEEFFKDKGVEIVYFPYTQSTNSTQLRKKIDD